MSSVRIPGIPPVVAICGKPSDKRKVCNINVVMIYKKNIILIQRMKVMKRTITMKSLVQSLICHMLTNKSIYTRDIL